MYTTYVYSICIQHKYTTYVYMSYTPSATILPIEFSFDFPFSLPLSIILASTYPTIYINQHHTTMNNIK